jgi:hypothetical protein
MRGFTVAIGALAVCVLACRTPQGSAQADPPAAATAAMASQATTPLEEPQRLLLLRMQVGYIDRELPYGEAAAPAGFEALVRGGAIDASQLDAARARWELEQGKASQDQRGFLWLTERLEETYDQAGRLNDATAIDEAALGRLDDAGYRQQLRCHLARLAANHGDLVSAHRWLMGNDERPTDINLDSELRMARVALAFAEHDWPTALRQLGRTRDDVPFASRWAVNASVKRAHALEQVGELGPAANELLYWMRGPKDRAMVLRVPAASFAQQIDRMATMHHYATESYALAKSRLKNAGGLASRT